MHRGCQREPDACVGYRVEHRFNTPGFFSTTAMVPSDMDSPMDGTTMSLRVWA